jgi:mono/diheme cytochrome c family protein
MKVFLVVATLTLLTAIGLAQDSGATIYKSKCASCHGRDGGGEPGPNLKMTKLSEDDIFLLLSKGDNSHKMPHDKAMSGLKDDQISTVARYVKSLSPK